ncbi:MAG: hypothetical protein KGQ59_00455 [Bdellovibrionales bacterium]|nr:hypothetical protein [Bdellovibrionales bacterium]
MDSSPPSKRNPEESQVDLGEDLLLEPTATRISDTKQAILNSEKESNPEKASGEEVQSAQILMSEGLWDEAKVALHRALRLQGENLLAKKLLEEIRERELRELLEKPTKLEPTAVVEEDILRVLHKLEEDWRLGLEIGESGRLSLLASNDAQADFIRCVLEQATSLSTRERADLAIGFLQMELPEVAISLLQPGSTQSGVGSALYCWALLQAGKAFECVSVLDVRLRDDSLSADVRREMEYLMARSREALGERRLALELYSALGDYRDSSSRRHRLQSLSERR